MSKKIKIFLDKKTEVDTLRLNLNKRKAHVVAKVFKYRDKDTRQIVYYIPSLELSGYGNTEEKAEEMLTNSFDDFFNWLISLSHNQIGDELIKLGLGKIPHFKRLQV